MTRATNVVYGAATLIGVTLGFVLGFRSATVTLKLTDDIERTSAVHELREFTDMQYRHAGRERATEALLTYMKFLEEMNRFSSDSLEKQGLAVGLAVSCVRLALIEDAKQNVDQSRAYIELARSWYKAAGRDYSDVQMKTAVKEFDGIAPQ
jgi:hypothetical protein